MGTGEDLGNRPAPAEMPPLRSPLFRSIWAPPLRASRGTHEPIEASSQARPSPLTDPVPPAGLISPFRLPAEIEDRWLARGPPREPSR
jgi:hypothetical protein